MGADQLSKGQLLEWSFLSSCVDHVAVLGPKESRHHFCSEERPYALERTVARAAYNFGVRRITFEENAICQHLSCPIESDHAVGIYKTSNQFLRALQINDRICITVSLVFQKWNIRRKRMI